MVNSETEQAHPGQPIHLPAMVPQVMELLAPGPGDLALDLTLGTGGHALELARAVGTQGALIGIDADRRAVDVARDRLTAEAECRLELHCARFSEAKRILDDLGVSAADVALADLGVGSHQLDRPEAGFGFESDARLDMRYDTTVSPSAWEVVNHADEETLAGIFHDYGEERYSRRIASEIVRQRTESSIDTPAELADLVKRVAARRTRRGRTWRIHPATRVMMALRIYVNREMEELDSLLTQIPYLLKPMGRAAILTYHSLEARRVKNAWRAQARLGLVEELTRSPVKPTEQQIEENPRVRSAQLRAIQKL